MMFSQLGTLDTTFGIEGKIFNNFGLNNQVYDSALQSDGKIIVVGNTYSYAAGSSFLIVRYLPNGDVDTSFGDSGHVTTLVGNHCSAQGVAVQTDGKIVVAGSTYAPDDDSNSTDIMITRYNTDGTLDSTFDFDGIKVINLDSTQSINALLIQNDGKIIVGGLFTLLTNPNLDTFGLARFNTNGSLDVTFGSNGFVYTPNIYRGEIMDLKFIGNEGIIAVGRGLITDDYILVRYTSNGEVVNSFGTNGNGIIKEAYNNIALLYKCVVSANNDIYAAGATYNGTKYNGFCVKYNSAGIIDATFGTNGKILRDFGNATSGTSISSFAKDISIDNNNNLMVGYGVGPTNDYDFGLESYTLNGALNTSFGDNGYFSTAFGSGHDYFSSMLIQPDNKIIMAGNKGGQVVARINNSELIIIPPPDVTGTKITIDTNPVKDAIDLILEMENAGTLNVDLFDTKGAFIAHLLESKAYAKGSSVENLSLLKYNLAQAVYFLKISNNSKFVKSIKILKV